MATQSGVVKKTSLDAFANIRSSGIIALTIDEDDALVERAHHRRAARRPARHAQRLGHPLPRGERARRWAAPRAACSGIRLREERRRWSAWRSFPRDAPATLLTVCERGYGKRTAVADYPTKNRGGKGVITIKTTERNGKVVGCRLVTDDDDLMLITDGGKLIRMPVQGHPDLGRNTQGVRLIRVDEGENVVAIERWPSARTRAGEVQARAESRCIAGEEDLSGDDDDDDGQVKTHDARTTTATTARAKSRR